LVLDHYDVSAAVEGALFFLSPPEISIILFPFFGALKPLLKKQILSMENRSTVKQDVGWSQTGQHPTGSVLFTGAPAKPNTGRHLTPVMR
jgi:hypothetical protein